MDYYQCYMALMCRSRRRQGITAPPERWLQGVYECPVAGLRYFVSELLGGSGRIRCDRVEPLVGSTTA